MFSIIGLILQVYQVELSGNPDKSFVVFITSITISTYN